MGFGKTLRRSYDASTSKAAIHMVSAWSCANKVVLGQVKTAEKSNEITAIPELLEILEIKGCIVTIDAMGCQEKIAQAIINKKADYIFSLKGNHSKLHTDVESFFKTSHENNFHDIKYDFHEECNGLNKIIFNKKRENGKIGIFKKYREAEQTILVYLLIKIIKTMSFPVKTFISDNINI